VTWPTRAGIATATALAVWLAGFVQGRRGRAAQVCPAAAVEAKDATAAKAEDHAASSAQVAATASRAKWTRRVRKLAIAPDGTKGCEETLDTFTDARQAAQAIAQDTRTKSLAESRVVSSTVVLREPWTFAAMGGLNAAALVGADRRWWIGGSTTHSFIGRSRLGLAVVKVQDQPMFVGVKVEVGR
jgi:hypothetical protein